MNYNERRGIRLGQRGGHLFHGRYYAIVYEKDEYLLALVRYIHLNPVRARLVKKTEQCLYPGHAEYRGSKTGSEHARGKAHQRFIFEAIEEGQRKNTTRSVFESERYAEEMTKQLAGEDVSQKRNRCRTLGGLAKSAE